MTGCSDEKYESGHPLPLVKVSRAIGHMTMADGTCTSKISTGHELSFGVATLGITVKPSLQSSIMF